MADYLAPVGPLGRRFALVSCFIATLISAAFSGITVAAMVQQGSFFDNNGKPLWVGACLMAFLTLVTGWMTARLWSGASGNGVTLMPVWFIEVFGGLMMVGMLLGVFVGQWHVLLLPGVISIALTMLLIRRQVRRHLRARDAAASGCHEGSSPAGRGTGF